MRFLGRLIALLFLIFPAAAAAAPFCVETQAIPRQCIYFDAASCNQRARQMGGYCSANESEVHATPGLGHYCLLTSSEVSMCIYTDRSDCNREALHQHGVCVQATTLPESPGADPYRDIRPSMAGN